MQKMLRSAVSASGSAVVLTVALILAVACDENVVAPPSHPALLPRPTVQTCRFDGTPAGFVADVSLTETTRVSLDGPAVALVSVPGDPDHVVVAGQQGSVVRAALDGSAATVVVDLSSRASRLFALTTEPEAVTPRHLFVAYAPATAPTRLRVSRFDLDATLTTASAGSERTIMELDTELGAGLAALPDGILMIATGDSDPDGLSDSAQDFADLRGKVLRVDVSNFDTLARYEVPPDNPLDPSGVPSAVFARGLRSPVHCAWSDTASELVCVDRGIAYDEVLRIEASDNHGWPRVDGTTCVAGSGRCSAFDYDAALVVHRHDEVECGFVGGARVFDTTSALEDAYFYGDACGGALRGFLVHGFRTYEQQLEQVDGGIAALGTSPTGGALVVANDGRVLSADAMPAERPFPERLSDSNCFVDVLSLEPAPDVVPYGVRSPLWSDGSGKERFLMVPAGQRITYVNDDIWGFPEGSVLFKGFSMELLTGDPSTRRLLEVRVLIKRRHQWQGHTYRFDEALGDAVLLTESAEEPLTVMRDGETLAVTHLFPDRFGCAICHGFRPPTPIALHTAQMDLTLAYGDVMANQLAALTEAGFFDVDPPSESARPRFPIPSDTSVPTAMRARAYLDANCAHCHQPGGWVPSTLEMDLRFDVPFADTNLCGVRSAYADGWVRVSPGDAPNSLIYERVSRRDLDRMPPIGTSIVDPEGLALLRSWIEGLEGCP